MSSPGPRWLEPRVRALNFPPTDDGAARSWYCGFMLRSKFLFAISLFLSHLACSESPAGLDAGSADAAVDLGVPADAGTSADAGTRDVSGDCTAETCPDGLPVRRVFDPAAAERGRVLLFEGGFAQPYVPRLAMENLWLIWGTGRTTGEIYWTQFRDRYGFFASPTSDLPLGIEDAGGGMLSLNCLVCHAGKVAGELFIGGSNDRLDLQGLFDDLVALNNRSPNPVPLPYTLENMTGAAGSNDAFGLGMKLSELYGPGGAQLNTEYGYQQPPAWWTMRFKERIYTDGSGQSDGYRTMMATMLAFGLSYSELQNYDDEFQDLHEYLLSLDVPKWPFDAPEEDAVGRGAALFEANCASCHGSYHTGDARYPNRVVPLDEVGTDRIRAENFTEREAAWINSSWFGEVPMESTGGYLAPALVGVWATAPYFHNASVPDLMGVLDSNERPVAWTRTGSERADYNPDRVGWRYDLATPVDGSTIEGRRVHDSTRPGLGVSGHDYGSALTASERADLLEYLKTL